MELNASKPESIAAKLAYAVNGVERFDTANPQPIAWIGHNASLDNYKDIGYYYCTADDYTRTMVGRPKDLNQAFMMKCVKALGDYNYIAQIITTYSFGDMYYRIYVKFQDQFRPWHRLTQSITVDTVTTL